MKQHLSSELFYYSKQQIPFLAICFIPLIVLLLNYPEGDGLISDIPGTTLLYLFLFLASGTIGLLNNQQTISVKEKRTRFIGILPIKQSQKTKYSRVMILIYHVPALIVICFYGIVYTSFELKITPYYFINIFLGLLAINSLLLSILRFKNTDIKYLMVVLGGVLLLISCFYINEDSLLDFLQNKVVTIILLVISLGSVFLSANSICDT